MALQGRLRRMPHDELVALRRAFCAATWFTSGDADVHGRFAGT
jgi:hypothetical protein